MGKGAGWNKNSLNPSLRKREIYSSPFLKEPAPYRDTGEIERVFKIKCLIGAPAPLKKNHPLQTGYLFSF
jgi:hypothetical protein